MIKRECFNKANQDILAICIHILTKYRLAFLLCHIYSIWTISEISPLLQTLSASLKCISFELVSAASLEQSAKLTEAKGFTATAVKLTASVCLEFHSFCKWKVWQQFCVHKPGNQIQLKTRIARWSVSSLAKNKTMATSSSSTFSGVTNCFGIMWHTGVWNWPLLLSWSAVQDCCAWGEIWYKQFQCLHTSIHPSRGWAGANKSLSVNYQLIHCSLVKNVGSKTLASFNS